MIETPAQDKLDTVGIEAICDDILNREPLRAICTKYEVSMATLLRWIDGDMNRSARVRDARRMTAWGYEEEAVRLLEAATTALEITRAREIAHHLRWRAAMIDPAYRNKLDMTHANPEGGPVALKSEVTHQSAADAYAKMLEGGK